MTPGELADVVATLEDWEIRQRRAGGPPDEAVPLDLRALGTADGLAAAVELLRPHLAPSEVRAGGP